MLNPGGGEAEKMSVRIVLPRIPSRQRSVKKAVRGVSRGILSSNTEMIKFNILGLIWEAIF